MKTKLLSLFTGISLGISVINAQVDANGYTTVEASMGAGYSNRLFFNLEDGKLTSQNANAWDVALYRVSPFTFGSRVNDAKYTKTYQVSANPNDWDNINIQEENNWGDSLYNPDKTTHIEEGAFETSDLITNCGYSTGWGCYNMGTHAIDGKVIFVLKDNNNNYTKFMIVEAFYGYKIKYSKWDSTNNSWEATVEKTIPHGNDNKYFNYFSFETGEKVENIEPDINNWSFMFTRYYTFYNNIMMYRMSGVIQAPNVTVAVAEETQETSALNLPTDDNSYSKMITTIGDSWKKLSGWSNVLVEDKVYYIKETKAGEIKYYRMYFTTVGGATTGDSHFKYKDITSLGSTTELGEKVVFTMYPNPAPNKQVTLLYDVKQSLDNKGIVKIFDMSGKKVYETEITKSAGFFKKEIDLSKLNAGIYLVNLTVGNHSETKKLILK